MEAHISVEKQRTYGYNLKGNAAVQVRGSEKITWKDAGRSLKTDRLEMKLFYLAYKIGPLPSSLRLLRTFVAI